MFAEQVRWVQRQSYTDVCTCVVPTTTCRWAPHVQSVALSYLMARSGSVCVGFPHSRLFQFALGLSSPCHIVSFDAAMADTQSEQGRVGQPPNTGIKTPGPTPVRFGQRHFGSS